MSAKIQIWGLEMVQWLSAEFGSSSHVTAQPLTTISDYIFNGICPLNKEVEDVIRFACTANQVFILPPLEGEILTCQETISAHSFPSQGHNLRTLRTGLPF